MCSTHCSVDVNVARAQPVLCLMDAATAAAFSALKPVCLGILEILAAGESGATGPNAPARLTTLLDTLNVVPHAGLPRCVDYVLIPLLMLLPLPPSRALPAGQPPWPRQPDRVVELALCCVARIIERAGAVAFAADAKRAADTFAHVIHVLALGEGGGAIRAGATAPPSEETLCAAMNCAAALGEASGGIAIRGSALSNDSLGNMPARSQCAPSIVQCLLVGSGVGAARLLLLLSEAAVAASMGAHRSAPVGATPGLWAYPISLGRHTALCSLRALISIMGAVGRYAAPGGPSGDSSTLQRFLPGLATSLISIILYGHGGPDARNMHAGATDVRRAALLRGSTSPGGSVSAAATTALAVLLALTLVRSDPWPPGPSAVPQWADLTAKHLAPALSRVLAVIGRSAASTLDSAAGALPGNGVRSRVAPHNVRQAASDVRGPVLIGARAALIAVIAQHAVPATAAQHDGDTVAANAALSGSILAGIATATVDAAMLLRASLISSGMNKFSTASGERCEGFTSGRSPAFELVLPTDVDADPSEGKSGHGRTRSSSCAALDTVQTSLRSPAAGLDAALNLLLPSSAAVESRLSFTLQTALRRHSDGYTAQQSGDAVIASLSQPSQFFLASLYAATIAGVGIPQPLRGQVDALKSHLDVVRSRAALRSVYERCLGCNKGCTAAETADAIASALTDAFIHRPGASMHRAAIAADTSASASERPVSVALTAESSRPRDELFAALDSALSILPSPMLLATAQAGSRTFTDASSTGIRNGAEDDGVGDLPRGSRSDADDVVRELAIASDDDADPADADAALALSAVITSIVWALGGAQAGQLAVALVRRAVRPVADLASTSFPDCTALSEMPQLHSFIKAAFDDEVAAVSESARKILLSVSDNDTGSLDVDYALQTQVLPSVWSGIRAALYVSMPSCAAVSLWLAAEVTAAITSIANCDASDGTYWWDSDERAAARSAVVRIVRAAAAAMSRDPMDAEIATVAEMTRAAVTVAPALAPAGNASDVATASLRRAHAPSLRSATVLLDDVALCCQQTSTAGSTIGPVVHQAQRLRRAAAAVTVNALLQSRASIQGRTSLDTPPRAGVASPARYYTHTTQAAAAAALSRSSSLTLVEMLRLLSVAVVAAGAAVDPQLFCNAPNSHCPPASTPAPLQWQQQNLHASLVGALVPQILALATVAPMSIQRAATSAPSLPLLMRRTDGAAVDIPQSFRVVRAAALAALACCDTYCRSTTTSTASSLVALTSGKSLAVELPPAVAAVIATHWASVMGVAIEQLASISTVRGDAQLRWALRPPSRKLLLDLLAAVTTSVQNPTASGDAAAVATALAAGSTRSTRGTVIATLQDIAESISNALAATESRSGSGGAVISNSPLLLGAATLAPTDNDGKLLSRRQYSSNDNATSTGAIEISHEHAVDAISDLLAIGAASVDALARASALPVSVGRQAVSNVRVDAEGPGSQDVANDGLAAVAAGYAPASVLSQEDLAWHEPRTSSGPDSTVAVDIEQRPGQPSFRLRATARRLRGLRALRGCSVRAEASLITPLPHGLRASEERPIAADPVADAIATTLPFLPLDARTTIMTAARQALRFVAAASGAVAVDYGAWADDGGGSGRRDTLGRLRITSGALLTLCRAAVALARHPADLLPLLADSWPSIVMLLPPVDIVPSADGAHLLPYPIADIRGNTAKDYTDALHVPALMSSLFPVLGVQPSALAAPRQVTSLTPLTRARPVRIYTASRALNTESVTASAETAALLESSRRYMLRRVALLSAASGSDDSNAHPLLASETTATARIGLQGWEVEDFGRNGTPAAGSGGRRGATIVLSPSTLPANSVSLIAALGGRAAQHNFPLSQAALAVHAAALTFVTLIAVAPTPGSSIPLESSGLGDADHEQETSRSAAVEGACAGAFLSSRFSDQVWPRFRALLVSAALCAAVDCVTPQAHAPSGRDATSSLLTPVHRLLAVALVCVRRLAAPTVTIQREAEEEDAPPDGGVAEGSDDHAIRADSNSDPAATVASFLRPDRKARGSTPLPTAFCLGPSVLRPHAWDVAWLLCAILHHGRQAGSSRFPLTLMSLAEAALRALHRDTDAHAVAYAASLWK